MEISSIDDSDQRAQSSYLGASVALTKQLTPNDTNNSDHHHHHQSSKTASGSTNVNNNSYSMAVEAMTTTPPSINTSSILKTNSTSNAAAFAKNSNFLFYFSNQYQSSKNNNNNKENNEDAISVDSVSSSSASSSCLSFSNFNNQNRPPAPVHAKATTTTHYSYHSTSNQQYVSVTASHGVSSSTNSTITTTVNPFEETNRHRLEQSVLSPNLFHVASTSTPERDTNCLWNIDQRAVLYPADIPTDESSLVAQYVHDQKLNRQLSAAVETFWSQNQIIIESPLAGAASGSQFGGSNGSSGSGYGPLRNRLNAAGSSQNSSARSNNFKSSFNVNSPLAASNNATPLSNKARTNAANNAGNSANSNNRNNHLNRFKQQHHHHHHQLQQQQSANFQKTQPGQNSKQPGKDDNATNQPSSSSPPSSATKQQQQSSKMLKQQQSTSYESRYCQTVLSFPTDFDLNLIPELKQFLNYNNNNDDDDAFEHINSSPPSSATKDANMKEEKTLNNSIRKKLFDHHSGDDHPDHPTLTTMATSYAAVVADTHRPVDDDKPKGQLPKPEFLPSSSTWSDIEMVPSSKLRSMKESTSSNWQEDSLEFQDDDHQFASSPKSYRKYSNIMHDIGDDDENELCFGTDATQDLDDSVFYTQQEQQQQQQQQNKSGSQRKPLTPPNVSPLLSYQDKGGHQEAHFEFKETK